MVFEYWKDGEVWRWHLKTADARILAVSVERYETEEDCVDAILLVKSAKNAVLKRMQA